MRLRGVARNAVSPRITAFAVSRCAREQLLGLQSLRIVLEQGKPAQAVLQAFGDDDLADQATQDELRGGVKPLRGQSVDHIVPGLGFDLIELLWRRGAALAGQHWHERNIRSGASRHDAGEPTISPAKVRKPAAQRLEMVATSTDAGRFARNGRNLGNNAR
jgi:hypothetical protein